MPQITNLIHVVSDYDVHRLAGQAARRAEAQRLHESGRSWSVARKQALTATPTPEMLAIVRDQLERGGCPETTIRCAMDIAMVTK